MGGKRGSMVVVGGGISGIQCALDLAENGFQVHVVDQNPTPGGIMGQLEKTFPTHDCAFCLLEPKLLDMAAHGSIEVIPNSEVTGVDGKAGDFKVKVSRLKRYIDPMICSDCGACFEQCDHISRFYAPLAARLSSMKDALKAIHHVYVIDRDRCDHCGDCEKVCKENAIITSEAPEERTIDAHGIVLSPGFRPFDPRGMSEYGYGHIKDVVTSLDLEQMMSAPGPHSGLVRRPSDGKVPKRVAFLQCVGSRDVNTNSYCSSLCCMAALKEAMILVERYQGIEPTIFYMDIRAFGKEYDDYYNIAKERYNVNFINSRASSIDADPEGGVVVQYVDGAGRPCSDRFDMAVLSIGLIAPMGARALAEAAGVGLNEHGFMRTSRFHPLRSSVEGIYGCGAFLWPKDIPDAVTEASGAAMMASIEVGKEAVVTERKGINVEAGGEVKVGVFVCNCGDDISKVVDTKALAEVAKGSKGVAHVEIGDHLCSAEGQGAIKKAIADKGLNRVVLAGCTPRLMDPVLKRTMVEAGLNPFLFEVANIREQVAWVHFNDRPAANDKAGSLLRMAVSKVNEDVPLPIADIDVRKACMVLGGGLSGMVAARALAGLGMEVHLVEKGDRLGGHLHHIKHLFAGEDDPQKELVGLVKAIEGEGKITVHLDTTMEAMDGIPGMFTSRLKGPDGEKVVEHGAVIVATGAIEYRPDEYLYGKDKRVVTQSELEGLMADGKVDPGTGTVVMVQCVGSRTKDFPNCSRICCGVAVKNALRLKEMAPGMEVYVLYKDIRTYGFMEDRFREARNKGVHFLQFTDEDLPEVSEGSGKLKVSLQDRILGQRISIGADLVVLSTGIRPNPDNEALSKRLKVALSKDHFLLEGHMKMRQVDFSTEGIFLCGLAHGPKNVSESVAQALAAASHAARLLSKDKLLGEMIVAEVNPSKCRGCARCEEQCEYGAIRVMAETVGDVERMVSKVDEAKCKGCGRCSVICCNKAISMRNYGTAQIERVIEAALEGP